MPTWSDIERVRKDPGAARIIARSLLHYGSDPDALSDWELDFLESIASRVHADEFSVRQIEKLFEVQDDVKRVTTHEGFNIARLIRGCYEGRLDLGEEDEEWIVSVFENDCESVRRRHIYRLMRCAKSLGLID